MFRSKLCMCWAHCVSVLYLIREFISWIVQISNWLTDYRELCYKFLTLYTEQKVKNWVWSSSKKLHKLDWQHLWTFTMEIGNWNLFSQPVSLDYSLFKFCGYSRNSRAGSNEYMTINMKNSRPKGLGVAILKCLTCMKYWLLSCDLQCTNNFIKSMWSLKTEMSLTAADEKYNCTRVTDHLYCLCGPVSTK